jgi:hypothetical protein
VQSAVPLSTDATSIRSASFTPFGLGGAFFTFTCSTCFFLIGGGDGGASSFTSSLPTRFINTHTTISKRDAAKKRGAKDLAA